VGLRAVLDMAVITCTYAPPLRVSAWCLNNTRLGVPLQIYLFIYVFIGYVLALFASNNNI